MKKGQINDDSLFGKELMNITNREDITNIVEIGTWNGMGSTKCILSKLRKNQVFYSIELYNEMYNEAIINLKNYIDNDNFHLLNGKIIDYDDVFWFDHKKEIDFTNDRHAQLWYKKDLENLKKGENISNKLPDNIDLLILDGGEYTTYPEWVKLKDRTKIVALDDTKVFKSKKIRFELLENQDYKLIIDNQKDRNGYSIFEKNK